MLNRKQILYVSRFLFPIQSTTIAFNITTSNRNSIRASDDRYNTCSGPSYRTSTSDNVETFDCIKKVRLVKVYFFVLRPNIKRRRFFVFGERLPILQHRTNASCVARYFRYYPLESSGIVSRPWCGIGVLHQEVLNPVHEFFDDPLVRLLRDLQTLVGLPRPVA